jgi:hypothetical protein
VPLPKVVRTTGFRLSALYALLFGACVLGLGAVALWSTRAALKEQLARRIEAEMTLLEQEFRQNGSDGLAAAVQQRTRVKGNLDYFVVDPAGKRLAGDLAVISDRTGWIEFPTAEGGDEPRRETKLPWFLSRRWTAGFGCRTSGSGRGACDETHVPTATRRPWRGRLSHANSTEGEGQRESNLGPSQQCRLSVA